MSQPEQTKAAAPGGSSRAGFVSIVGRANVGKSTLLNALLGEKVSIVSPVAQTTRNLIRAVLSDVRGQLVFLDTPGMHKARHDLGRLMNTTARSAAVGADVVMLALDVSTRPRIEDHGWMTRLSRQDVPLVFALNKADITEGSQEREDHEAAYRSAWAQAAAERKSGAEPTWLRVSAVSGRGLNELTGILLAAVPEGPRLFPDDMLSDFPRKLALADVVREKFFLLLREELPHCIAVCVENIFEKPEGWIVTGEIFVHKDSQKGIVIGRKGAMLGAARREAEKELSEIYETPVRLELRVKVRPDWSRDKELLRRLGYLPG